MPDNSPKTIKEWCGVYDLQHPSAVSHQKYFTEQQLGDATKMTLGEFFQLLFAAATDRKTS